MYFSATSQIEQTQRANLVGDTLGKSDGLAVGFHQELSFRRKSGTRKRDPYRLAMPEAFGLRAGHNQGRDVVQRGFNRQQIRVRGALLAQFRQ